MFHLLLSFLFVFILLALAAGRVHAADSPFRVERIGDGPVIHRDNDPDDGKNHNLMGACLVRTPTWLPDRLGAYYLYFGRHHNCGNIYLAHADDLAGPWTVRSEAVLRVVDTVYGPKGNHIASPEVSFDATEKRAVMLFHGNSKQAGHNQSVATSADGLHFTGADRVLSGSSSIGYLRMIPDGDGWLGIGKSGTLWRTDDLVTGAYTRTTTVPEEAGIKRWRHGDLFRHRETLYAIYSCLGDTPERIRLRRIVVDERGKLREAGEPVILLSPELPWEGSELPVVTSQNGEAKQPEHALRDPAVMVDADGTLVMAYAVQGEYGIALARLIPQE